MHINMSKRFVPNWSSVLSVVLILSNSFSIVTSDNYTFEQMGQDIDGEAAGDHSGISVSLSYEGKIVAVGANGNDGVNGTDSGHARVYKYVDGSWEQMGQDLDGEDVGDWSGYLVDLSGNGNIIAVGAVYNSDAYFFGGHVRVHKYNGNIWEQLGGDLDGDGFIEYFGSSLALSRDGTVLASAGISYIQVQRYDELSDSWNIIGHAIPRDTHSIKKGCLSLASDGSVVAFSEFALNQVRVYGYVEGPGEWIPMGPNITRPGGRFGWSVSLSGDGTTLGVGSDLYNNETGRVTVLKYNGMNWAPLGNPIDGPYDYAWFGDDIALSSDGQRIVIGATGYDAGGHVNTNFGKVVLYEYDGVDTWVQLGQKLVGEAPGDIAGWSVALSGDGRILASGAPGNNGVNGNNTGHARVYRSKRVISPGASGDPHFKTWSGESYDFHGLCDLVLLKNEGFKSGLGMYIHIRTKKMKQWSYISNAVLRIGEDVLEVMGEANGKTATYWMNGVAGTEEDLTDDNTLLSDRISGYPIYYKRISPKQHEFSVVLGEDEKIVVKTWKELVRVDIQGATQTNFGGSLGLMGTFGGGYHMGRDGRTVLTDFNDFGQEWQVLPSEPFLFYTLEGPQAPEKCTAPSSTLLRRRLSENIISQDQAVIACAGVNEEDRDMCIFDIMATNDMEISGAY